MGKDFTATDGWFSRWKKRANLVYCKPHGESRDADVEKAASWLRQVCPGILSDHGPENIFNAGETCLY